MAKALQIFKRKLTNLSSANPTLWMRRLKADIHLDLTDAENALGFSSWQLLSELFGGKKKVALIPVADPRNADTNLLSQKLHTLVRRQELVLQERGVDQLFLAFGFVLGCWPDGSWVRTPLVYFPCSIGHNQKTWSLSLDAEAGFINPSFLLAYAFHFKQVIESSLFEKELEIEAEDGLSFLTALYNLLKNSHLEIHFNQEFFSQKIGPFPAITKETIPAGYQPGMLRLQPNAVLGLFPQSDSVLVSDFEYLERYQVDLESIFLNQIKVNQSVSEKSLLCPLPVDGSQEECIRKIKSGQSLVVQGPPGTGKSQLISNVIADAIATGKSVLLVCQKRVALEVVLTRLKGVGVDRFIALWADYKKDREAIFKQLAEQVDDLEEAERANNKLDTVVLERQFAFASQTIEQICQNLEEYRTALFDFDLAGISVKELYSRPVKYYLINFDEALLIKLKWDEWEVFSNWISKNWPAFSQTLRPEFQLYARKNWATIDSNDFEAIPNLWSSLADRSMALKEGFQSKQQKDCHKDWENDLEVLSEVLGCIVDHSSFLRENGLEFLFQFSPQQWMDEKVWSQLVTDINRLDAVISRLQIWPEGFLLDNQLIEKQLKVIIKWKGHSKFGFWWHIVSAFSGEVGQLKKVAGRLGIPFTSMPVVEENLGLAREFGALSETVFSNKDASVSKEGLETVKHLIAVFRKKSGTIEAIRKDLATAMSIVFQLDSWLKINETHHWASSLQEEATEIRQKWLSFFQSEPKVQLPGQPSEIPHWIEVFKTFDERILAADMARLSVSENWTAILEQVVEHQELRALPKTELANALSDFWTQAWVQLIESKYPVLQQASSEIWNEDLNLLREKIVEKQNLTAEILRQRLREQTYKDLEHNRLRNRVTYRDLYHQVTKKRQRWPMRKLWHQSGQEILKLIPAWLATPESVSATWPMEMQFDLVIFDEASQCFAEKGIPSAFRGSQLVVIGDDKQLSPNHLFTSRWEEEDEDEATFSEQDSLLDLAKQFLPQVMLRSHYRSVYPELIEFSNLHFYHNKLESIPLPDVYQNRIPALMYEKVNGIWKNQQNEIEADHLCTLLLKRLESNHTETFGIITFNQKQQTLIERRLDQLAGEKGVVLPESLFIKNIENVQGDERDHILFSIAYARNEQGKVTAQFGSLNQSGGENRLNVAISRAKKSVTIVASILPNELTLSESAPLGPSLLKKYLEFVYVAMSDRASNSGVWLKTETIDIPFADSAQADFTNRITLSYEDGERMNAATSMKDFFGFKYLNLTTKGYRTEYSYSRNTWLKKIGSLRGE